MHKFEKLTTATMFGALNDGPINGYGAKADNILRTRFS